MFKLTAFCVFFFAVSFCRCKNLLKNDKCKTPDSKDGKCIVLKDCPSLFEDANDLTSPMDLNRLNLLISSQCGFKSTIPKVCCPLQELKDETNKNNCETPDLKKGRCVLLEECPPLYKDSNDLISPMTIDRLNFLIGSQCGFRGLYPKVCCAMQDKLL